MKPKPIFLFRVKFFDILLPTLIEAHSHLEAAILACADRIKEGKHIEIDYTESPAGERRRLHFTENRVK